MRSLLTVLALGLVLAVPGSAQAAAGWQSGPLSETYGNDCITGDVIAVAGSYMSYYADPNSPPLVGQTFYLAVNATGIGDTCPGTYADPQLLLPAGVQLAIDASHPVQCFLEFPGQSSFQRDTSSDCPQSLPLGLHGYSLDFMGVNPPFWPLPVGGSIEMNIPVVATSAGALQFGAYIQTADGGFNQTMLPTVLAIVNAANTAPAQQLGIGYATPSITGDTPSSTAPARDVAIKGFVYNHSNSGTAFAELGQPPHGSGLDCSNPGAPTGLSQFYDTNSANLATGPNSNTQITGTFTTLYPAHNYCWRVVAHIGATIYYGNWEPFVTQGSHYAPDPESTTPITVANCSGSTGNGCSSSTCAGTSTCGTAACTGPSCLTAFAPKLSSIPVVTPPPAGTTTTAPPPPPPPLAAKLTTHTLKVTASSSGHIAIDSGLSVACPAGTAACKFTLTAITTVPVTSKKSKAKTKLLTVGTAKASIAAGKTTIVKFTLNSAGTALLKKKGSIKVKLLGNYTGPAGTQIISKTITVKTPPKPKAKKKKH